MKTLSALLFSLMLVFHTPAFSDTALENLDLFLLVGQSNMAGRGKVTAQDQSSHPRIFMLTKDLQWTPAKDPVHFDKPIAGVGLASEFARVLAEANPQARIGLIPCAVGGTSLDQWKVGGQLYTSAVERAREAMKRGKLRGILWHQGEADSAPEKVATYPERFATMMTQLRKDLDAESVPVVIGELGRFRPASKEFNAKLPAVAAAIPNCAYVTAEDLADNNDKLHFDAASLRTFGRRYATALQKLVGAR